MDDYYLAGDERFGCVSSHMYSLMTKVPMANKLYDFALSDMSGFDVFSYLKDRRFFSDFRGLFTSWDHRSSRIRYHCLISPFVLIQLKYHRLRQFASQ